jgi:3-deoxy-D-manno-octulosonate 8-phosphate phosphatase (KDO 8-P phosphatase)
VLVKLLILDVDGVLTPGDLPYSADGVDVKTFFVQDGGAIRLCQSMGHQAAILSGRDASAVLTRARDVGISFVRQGLRDKLPAYMEACRQFSVNDDEVAFVGDDWVDLTSMYRCAYPIAVANASADVKRAARYITRRRGGHGAVTEAIERLLRHNGQWSNVREKWSRVPSPTAVN